MKSSFEIQARLIAIDIALSQKPNRDEALMLLSKKADLEWVLEESDLVDRITKTMAKAVEEEE